jgi:phage/plasmid-associated DNA primase
MSTNDKPEIPDGSEAIWDRLKLIPFVKRFDGARADPKLPEKLRGELAGVLAWAVRGCVEWHHNGLGKSKAVDKATAAYRAETDVLERFFQDECDIADGLTVTKKTLFEAWTRWCDAEGEDAGTQHTFTKEVAKRGVVKIFEEGYSNGKRVWKRLALSATPPSDPGSVPVQNPSKQGGITTNQVHLSEDSTNFSPRASHVEGFGEKDEKVYLVHLDEIIHPSAFEVDGVEWDYIDASEES